MPWDVFKKQGKSDAQIKAIYANKAREHKSKSDSKFSVPENSSDATRKEALARRLKAHRMGK